MKTQKNNIKRVSFIALFAIMALTLQVNNLYSQARAGRNNAPAFSSTPETVIVSTIQDTSTVIDSSKVIVNKKVKKAEKKANLQNEKFYVAVNTNCKHEFNVWAGGGFSSLNAFPAFGDRNYRLGGIFGTGYAYHFNPHWTLSIGAEFAWYNMKMQINDLTDDYLMEDPDGEEINYITNIDGYTEKERLYQLNIPLQLWYKTPINARGDEIYLSLGGKFGLPLSSMYSNHDAQFQTAGYYPSTGQTLYDQRDLGYGDNSGKTLKEELKFKCSYIGSAEAGIKWNLNSPRCNLYTGLYFDYGFNDILKSNDNNFLEYDHRFPDRFRTNSVLTSQYTQKGETNSFTDKVSVVALGIKVRLGINLCAGSKFRHNKEKIEKPEKIEKIEKIEPVEQSSIVRNIKPIDYTPAPTQKEPYYTSDPLLAAEMKRAINEYGKLIDLLVLYVDGYEPNQSKLSPVMEKEIDEKIRMLQKYNNNEYIIICEGHTCDLGREEFNYNLGLSRAEAIKEYLMNKGFNGDNLVATSKGKTTPIVENTSETNRKINRRVVFLIKEKH